MKKKLLVGLLSGLSFLVIAFTSQASPVELVTNGEFEDGPSFSSDWTMISDDSMPGWSSSQNVLEIWQQGVLGSPIIGSDEVATRKHHEVDNYYTTQSFDIISDGVIDFSFDSWKRNASGITYSLTGSLSGLLVSGTHNFSANLWENIQHTGLSVLSGENVTLSFYGKGGGTCGAHIDQVSVLYKPVPIPSAILLLVSGLAGLAGTRFRRKK